MPEVLPLEGLIAISNNGLRFGVWIMPDNSSPGMLETFLRFLLPDPNDSIWTYAQDSTVQARKMGACFKEVHQEKADIHTWLSWQNPPGQRFGIALAKHILNPDSPYAATFVSWFRKLFELDNKNEGQSV